MMSCTLNQLIIKRVQIRLWKCMKYSYKEIQPLHPLWSLISIPIWALQPLLTVLFSLLDPEWRWGHWQVVPGPSSACQTVSDLASCLATGGLESEWRCYTCHQLRPAVCSSQARTWLVIRSISLCSVLTLTQTHHIHSHEHNKGPETSV